MKKGNENVAEILENDVKGSTTADDLGDDGQLNNDVEGIAGDDIDGDDDGDSPSAENLLEELAGEESSSDDEDDDPVGDLPGSDSDLCAD